jgi:hypothetical protein
MRLRYPPRSHAPTDLGAVCSTDHGPGDWQRPAEAEQRLWRVVSDAPITDERHGRADWGLQPGTGLRLDGVRTRHIEYPEDGPQWQRGGYEVIERRFCVLDGAMAGTCWETREERPVGSGVPFRGDRVEPVERWLPRSNRS